MKKQIFGIAVFCVTVIFLGALISRDLPDDNVSLTSLKRSLDSESTEEGPRDSSCSSLCFEAYCEGEMNSDCIEPYNTCFAGCDTIEKDL